MTRKLLLSLVILLASLLSFGQSGTLKGKITDAETGEPIPFANVVIQLGGKMVNGAQSDFDGKFEIKPIPPGKYDVKASYIGYKSKLIQGLIINANRIRVYDIQLESSSKTLEEVEVVSYKVPLIDKDQTSTGGTMTEDEIDKMPGRSAESMAITVGGVFSDDNGNMGGIRGSRSGGTATYIDGMRVIGSSSLPKSAISQVAVITGGTPASFGDLTGGVINITTKGPSRQFGAGAEIVTSELLDGYGYNLGAFSINGPLIKGDSSKSSALLGFFLSAEGRYVRDGSPASHGTYRANNETLEYLRNNPVRPSGSGFGSFDNSNYIHKEDLINLHTRENAESYGANISGKIDVRTTELTNLSFGGTFNWSAGKNWSQFNSMFNPENNGVYDNKTWRVYSKFSQRFKNSEDKRALIKNVYYSLQLDYSQLNNKLENQYHGDDLFNYGYVGKFNTHTVNSYEYGSDTTLGLNDIWVHNGFLDTLYEFERSEINPVLSNYTDQYYQLYESNAFYRNALIVQNGGALLNGQLPNSVYGLWSNAGTPYNGYQKVFGTQLGFNASASFDIGNHEIQFGFQYEQRSTSTYSLNPVGLWTLMRQLANSHIEQLDKENPIMIYDADGIFQDTVMYNRLYDANTHSFFDKQLREKLGFDMTGLNWIDIGSYDPTTFSVDMFSADELLNSGNPYVFYQGYDHTGKRLNSKPSFEEFFTGVDENGNNTRAIGAYEPIYMAGYIQDKFAFDDLIFTVGVRIDRFDANQKVLKDPYLFSEARTVKEVTDLNSATVTHPGSMGDDYVVYVNDLNRPTAIVGYRNGSDWYNAKGQSIVDPTDLATASGIAPLLVDPNNNELSPNAFKDYEPQITAMPRISFSFPISDEALFFAHYDVLTSRPTSGNTLNLLSYYFLEQQGQSVINNPNLKPERTTDYELGFQQKLTNSSSIKFSAYYREFRDQIQVFRFSGAYPVDYLSFNNIDFGTTKGVTISYDLRRTKNLWLKVSYTLQFANATGSSTTTAVNLIRAGQPNLRTLSPINSDRNHTVSVVADYRYGRGKDYFGPKITRKTSDNKVKYINLLENTGVNATFFGGSGLPYSRQSDPTSAILGGGNTALLGSINGSRLPWQLRVDLKIDRDIYIKAKEGSKRRNPHYMNVYLQVLNVLNTKNIMGVYRYTGNPDDDGYLSAPEFQAGINSQLDTQSFIDLYDIRVNNPYNYSLPRRIRLGVMFNF